MAVAGAAALAAAPGAVADITMASAANTEVNVAEIVAKMIKKGEDAAKGIIG